MRTPLIIVICKCLSAESVNFFRSYFGAMFRILNDPPRMTPPNRSGDSEGAESPALRGAFCFGLLTDPMATHL